MAQYLINLQLDRELDLMKSSTSARPIRETALLVGNALKGARSGAIRGATLSVLPNSTNCQNAGAFVLLSSGSGTVGPTIDGTAATVTWATSDTNTAGLIVTAIHAAAGLNGIVLARQNVASVALTSVAAGDDISILGYRFTAASGTQTDLFKFDMSGDNTADALALATKINAAPGLSSLVFADSVTSTVYIGLKPGVSIGANQTVLSNASTMVVTNGTFAASAQVLMMAVTPGKVGNTCVISASGTGTSIAGSRTKLANGSGWAFTATTNFAQGVL